jgi:cytochrome c
LALRAGGRAVVADPDRDRVLVVSFANSEVEATFQLEAGAEPGRIVEGVDGQAFVVLRGTGEILTLDLATLSLGERRFVCEAPRGLAYDAQAASLLVTCAEGQLFELPDGESVPTRSTPIGVDARDIALRGNQRAVTRFRSAQVLLGDATGNWLTNTIPNTPAALGEPAFAPEVAWRMVVAPDQKLFVAHQIATTATLVVSEGGPNGLSGVGGADSGAAGAAGAAGFFGGGFGSSSYGSDLGCGGVVQTVVTVVAADGTFATSHQLGGIVLPVDIAISPKDGTVAVANAGRVDNGVNPRGTASVGIYSQAMLSPTSAVSSKSGSCVSSSKIMPGVEPVVAVAFEPTGLLLAQTREPSELRVYDLASGLIRGISLGGASVLDTGHEIFHRDAGRGIACASCHPEGTDDGRVWSFSPIGLRRTQPLDVGLEGTEPFHWGGELKDFDALMTEVFNVRMGGPSESGERLDALKSYIFGLTPRPGIRAVDDPAALRGKELFQSPQALCSSCHAGAKLTSSLSVDIGKGRLSQVPSLVGVSRRAPFMSDGCAATLLDRFNPACGGEKHGNTADLDSEQIADLVAYLESL